MELSGKQEQACQKCYLNLGSLWLTERRGKGNCGRIIKVKEDGPERKCTKRICEERRKRREKEVEEERNRRKRKRRQKERTEERRKKGEDTKLSYSSSCI